MDRYRSFGILPHCSPILANAYKMELYDIRNDWTQYDNVADRYPGRLREMQELMWAEFAKCQVLPLDASIVEAIAVGRKRADRRAPGKPVESEVAKRKLALPGIGHPAAVGVELVAPAELRFRQSAAGGKLPFGFGRQCLAGPGGKDCSILEWHLHDRVALMSIDRACAGRPDRPQDRPRARRW